MRQVGSKGDRKRNSTKLKTRKLKKRKGAKYNRWKRWPREKARSKYKQAV